MSDRDYDIDASRERRLCHDYPDCGHAYEDHPFNDSPVTYTGPDLGIEAAARREQAAEHNRTRAEHNWRAAWWQTTVALATPDENDRPAITAVYDAAEKILGQSRSWLSDRRMVGRRLADLLLEQKITLPPRLSMEYARNGGDPADAVAVITAAEADGVSLRDFAAQLGTQPTSWQREGEREPAPLDIDTMDADEKAELARDLIKDPDVADRVAADPEAAGHALGAIERHTEREKDSRRGRPSPEPATPGPVAVFSELAGLLVKHRQVLLDLTKLAQSAGPVAQSADFHKIIVESAVFSSDTWTVLVEIVSGTEDADAALARMVAEGQSS
jgi:hypothetical protein